MSLKSWLYKRAVAYIGKCNQEWERPNIRHDLQNLDRLTYRNCDKAYLLYGSDAEWSKFSRYEVLDNAIQKLAMYEDRKELMVTKVLIFERRNMWTNKSSSRKKRIFTLKRKTPWTITAEKKKNKDTQSK